MGLSPKKTYKCLAGISGHSNSLSIREIRSKITVRYLSQPAWMAIKKKKKKTNVNANVENF